MQICVVYFITVQWDLEYITITVSLLFHSMICNAMSCENPTMLYYNTPAGVGASDYQGSAPEAKVTNMAVTCLLS